MNTKIKKLSYVIRQTLLVGGAATSMLVANAHAAEAGSQVKEDDAKVEVIEVTGQRLANKRAIAAKQDSMRILDAIASDDIGALPDFNIGDAVQRISGVTIENDQNEARFITIRGLSAEYNYMTIDGMVMAVPDRGGRRAYMDALPASLAGKIEVYKSLTPDLDGQGIGGVVNIVSRSAWDFDDEFFKISGEVGQYQLNDGYEGDNKISGQGDFVWANTTDDDSFGWVVTGNYYNRDSYSPQTFHGNNRNWVDSTNPNGGNLDPYSDDPNAVMAKDIWSFNYLYHNHRTRYGLSSVFEWRPNETSSFMFRSYYNSSEDDEARQSDTLRLRSYTSDIAVDSNGDMSGSGLASQNITLGQLNFTRNVWGNMAKGEFNFDDDSKLEVAYNYTGSYFRNDELWNRWDTNSNTKIEVDFFTKASDGTSTMAINNFDWGHYLPQRMNELDIRDLDEDIHELKVDYGFNYDGSGEGWGYKTGARISNTKRTYFETETQYEPIDKEAVNYSLADTGVASIGPCFGGCVNVGQIQIDSSRVWNQFENELAANPDNWNLVANQDWNIRDNYELSESVFAAYGMATHTGENHFLVFGLRYENTNWNGDGYIKNNTTGVWSPIHNNGDYDNLLPSVNFSYELMDDVKLRLAASKAIGRVGYDTMAPIGESISLNDATGEVSVRGKNTELKPRESTNLDASIEWYLNGGEGILSAAIFRKVLKDELLAQTIDIDPIFFEGELRDATFNTTINSDEDITIDGIELTFVTNFDDYLPIEGLGMSANLTFVDSDFEGVTGTDEEIAAKLAESGYYKQKHIMPGSTDENRNVALFYESDTFSARVAYIYTGYRLNSVNDNDPWKTRYFAPKEVVDMKFGYKVSENFDLSLSLNNVFDEKEYNVYGRDQEITRITREFGRTVFFGATYKM